MQKLERIKLAAKISALIAMVLAGRQIADLAIPTDVAHLRKLLIIGTTVVIVDAGGQIIFKMIDKHFDKIITDIGADIIGMEG